MATTANAKPSKTFFVEMLTRDIELGDAILDLIDNCIDGIQRQLRSNPLASAEKPFQKFSVVLTVNKRKFCIQDNCGGIPRQVAEKYAFRLGRPTNMPRENLPTVGVYGIGMKRAVFKMGRNAKITSTNEGKTFSVAISPDWMNSDDDWELPITDIPKNQAPQALRPQGGTIIEIDKLLPTVADDFDSQISKFLGDLKGTIATHYSYIIHKGFSIIINNDEIKPKALNILVSAPRTKSAKIEPFVYQAKQDSVSVELIVGLYRDIPGQKEVDDELDGKVSANRETCGWTVICNDRVVLYADKTRLTGWGDATVPSYHPQFNAIAGIVKFQSLDMSKLPVTTTKRGLEAGSELYLAVRDVMREGLKHFTTFTNHWKAHGTERNVILSSAKPVDPFEAVKILKDKDTWSEVRRGIGGKKYVPKLPRPAASVNPTSVLIKFSRPKDQVIAVADFIFDDPDIEPSKIGEELFDQTFSRVKK